MRNESVRRHYLSAMGIVNWVERALPIQVYRVTDQETPVTLVAQATEVAQHQLWNNLIHALRRVPGEAMTVSYFERDDFCRSPGVVILLGNVDVDFVSCDKLIVTHSLQHMVQQPTSKADVWHVIKNTILK